MSNETELNQPKRRRGRPTKAEVAARNEAERQQKKAEVRRKRVPVSGNRDILTVHGKDPNYMYRWVLDSKETGQRIWKFKQAGYDHVTSDEVQVGDMMVYKSDNVGSIVRHPAGKENYLYLMKIRKEWYEEDQAAKMEDLAMSEKEHMRERDTESDDGMYGGGRLQRGRIPV